MTGLPRKYAKMGFKKGWRLFKAKRHKVKTTVSHSKSKRRIYTMARRHKKRSKKSMGGMGNIFSKVMNIGIGALGAVAWEMWVSPLIPIGGMVKNLIEIVVGIVLAGMRGMPSMVRSGGIALATINAYQIIASFMSGTTSSESAWG